MNAKMKISFAALAVVIASAGMSYAAPYVDDASTYVLLHMDEVSAGGPYTTPDDDSGSDTNRNHSFLLWGPTVDGTPEHYDPVVTSNKFVAGQAGYGNAIRCDGVDDRLIAFTGTTYDDLGVVAADEVRVDISAKSEMVKNDDNSVHSLLIQPNRYQILFYDRSQGDWRIDFRIWTDAGLQTVAITDVDKGIDITQWHEYSIKWENGIVEGFIDNVSMGTTVATGTVLDSALRDFHIGADHQALKHWGGLVDEFRIRSANAPAPASPYDTWISQYAAGAGSETNKTDNPDGDSLSNVYEWGLGGDPTNGADIGHVPTHGTVEDGGTNWFEYVYAQRNDAGALGLDYYLELTSDLVVGSWVSNNYVVGTGTLDGDFDAVTNRVSTDSEDAQFVRLIIESN